MSDPKQAEPIVSFDALMPAEMAVKAENVGVRKAELPLDKLLLLAVLAGAFIAMGAEFCTITVTGTAPILGFGLTKLIGGLVFTLGLILVVVAGAELFTGNALIVMAYASGKVSTISLLRNWLVVYIGNFAGSILTAILLFFSKQYAFAGGAVGATALNIAESKCALDFWPALLLGVYCNALVCLAVWLCFSARTTTDRILAIIPPIAAFVASGFEHCVANMYFIPMGLFIKADPSIVAQVNSVAHLTWANFLVRNLVPVTIGNIIGGAGLVGFIYWWIHLRPSVRVPAGAGEKLGATADGIPLGTRDILVVDDDVDFNFAVTAQLEHEGYDVRSVYSAAEARQAIEDHRPDLVILDIKMETETAGLDLLKALRADSATADLPVVLVSSASVSGEHGADTFLAKPVQFSTLSQTVAETMEKGGD
ncbi:MAG: formate/nitrite transporter family protein [Armatimonadetes bacterium]|nr:formate/nitrite transporter family protein [Armatimonadota bacterium]